LGKVSYNTPLKNTLQEEAELSDLINIDDLNEETEGGEE
jgi:hypothetical protein